MKKKKKSLSADTMVVIALAFFFIMMILAVFDILDVGIFDDSPTGAVVGDTCIIEVDDCDDNLVCLDGVCQEKNEVAT